MPLFAFLSGLVFSSLTDCKLIRKKLVKQSYKLLLPFLTMGVLYSFTIRRGEDFFLQPYKLGLWYLLFLWQCYVITNVYNFIFISFVNRHYLWRVFADIIWLLVVYGIAKGMMIQLSSEFNGMLGTVHLLKLYPFFFIGSVLKREKIPPPIWCECNWVVSISSMVWLLLIWNINIPPSQYPLKNFLGLGMFAIIPIVYWFAKFERKIPTKVCNTLTLFGRYSLEIYMLHRFMTSTCDMSFIGNFILTTRSWMLEFFLVLSSSLIMSWASVYAAKILSLNKIFSYFLLGQFKFK